MVPCKQKAYPILVLSKHSLSLTALQLTTETQGPIKLKQHVINYSCLTGSLYSGMNEDLDGSGEVLQNKKIIKSIHAHTCEQV